MINCDFINELKSEGVLKLFIDLRSGSARDWSGNDNHGVMTGTVWTGKGAAFPGIASEILVADSPGIQLTEVCCVAFGDFDNVKTSEGLISKRDVGGVNYSFYKSVGSLNFYDGISFRSLAADTTKGKCLAVNACDGETPEGFMDGKSVGNFNGTVALTVDDAPLQIGNILTTNNLIGNLKAALVISRKLTATEHSRLYGELAALDNLWPSRSVSKAQVSLGADPSDDSLLGAWGMQLFQGIIPDQSPRGADLISVTSRQSVSLLGPVQDFDGAQTMMTEDNEYTNLDFNTNGCTVEMFFKTNAAADVDFIFDMQGRIRIRESAGTLITEAFAQPTGFKTATSDVVLAANAWYHVVLTAKPNGAVIQTLNGVEQAAQDAMTLFNIAVGGRPLAIGSQYDGTVSTTAVIGATAVYNEVKSLEWRQNRYNQLKTAQWKTEYGIRNTVVPLASGFLSNSPFVLAGATCSVIDDVLDGQIVKSVECTVGGDLLVPDLSQHFANINNYWYGWLDTGAGYVYQALFITNRLLTLSAGDKLIYSSQNGDRSIVKQLVA